MTTQSEAAGERTRIGRSHELNYNVNTACTIGPIGIGENHVHTKITWFGISCLLQKLKRREMSDYFV